VGVYRSPALEVNRIVAKWRLPGELPVTVRVNFATFSCPRRIQAPNLAGMDKPYRPVEGG
jgi:hypothetical protein